jgi:hypothetical protein
METPAKSMAEYCPAIMVSTTVELKWSSSASRMGEASLIKLRHWEASLKVVVIIDINRGVTEENEAV